MPFVKPGGYFIAMKSSGSDDETAEAESAIHLLGGRLEKTAEYVIPGTDIVRRGVVIKKISNTPKKYPRRFAKMQKEPL
jgi:16S rRNA (guanine527-N7)-methyltransferase